MNSKRAVRTILVGLVIVGLMGVTAWGVRAYRAPLGPALKNSAPASKVEQPAAKVVPTAAQADVCGEPGAWNLLALGSDASDLRGDKGSDLIRVLRVDFPNKKVTVYAFPRTLWVDISELGFANMDAAPLGTVFYEARSRSASANEQYAMVVGTSMTANTLRKNFHVTTDHYLTVDLAQLPAMVDTVGGVPINIPVETTDPWIGMVIPAGQQTLNGEQFIAYARAKPDSDFGRIERNNLLMRALREKALDPSVWAKIPELYLQFGEVIATDLSPEQINHLACLLKEVPAEAITQEQVKPEWTSPGPQAGSLLWNKDNVLNQLKELGLVQ